RTFIACLVPSVGLEHYSLAECGHLSPRMVDRQARRVSLCRDVARLATVLKLCQDCHQVLQKLGFAGLVAIGKLCLLDISLRRTKSVRRVISILLAIACLSICAATQTEAPKA